MRRLLTTMFVVALLFAALPAGAESAPRPHTTCNGLPATIIGTGGADILIGTNGDDVIVGLAGNDLIRGKKGNDTICGGDGDDFLGGGPGDDHVFGGMGNDTVRGAGGHDWVWGDEGNDLVSGNWGRDAVFGGPGDDVTAGGRGKDSVSGEQGFDTVFGGDGPDSLRGGTDNDILIGGDGGDRLQGDSGNDTLRGLRGADVLVGGEGFDTERGGNGIDRCYTGEDVKTCEPLPPCSAWGMSDQLAPQVLPAAVAQVRQDIVSAAVACDWALLDILAGNDFAYNIVLQGFPSTYWQEREALGEDPMRILVLVMRMDRVALEPPSVADYVWPSAFDTDYGDLSQDEMDQLWALYDATDILTIKDFGYLLWRSGIDDTGDWKYFLAGD